VRDRVLAAARSKDKDHAEEAVDVVIPVLELAAQLDDLEIEADSRPVLRMRPRGSATPSTWGLIAAKVLRKEWGVLAHELGHLVAGDRVIEAVGPDGPRSQRETGFTARGSMGRIAGRRGRLALSGVAERRSDSTQTSRSCP